MLSTVQQASGRPLVRSLSQENLDKQSGSRAAAISSDPKVTIMTYAQANKEVGVPAIVSVTQSYVAREETGTYRLPTTEELAAYKTVKGLGELTSVIASDVDYLNSKASQRAVSQSASSADRGLLFTTAEAFTPSVNPIQNPIQITAEQSGLVGEGKLVGISVGENQLLVTRAQLHPQVVSDKLNPGSDNELFLVQKVGAQYQIVSPSVEQLAFANDRTSAGVAFTAATNDAA